MLLKILDVSFFNLLFLFDFLALQGCIKLTLEKFRILALNPTLLAIYSGPIQLGGFHWKLCAERRFFNLFSFLKLEF